MTAYYRTVMPCQYLLVLYLMVTETSVMPAHDTPTVMARRQRLQEWIDSHFEGKQALFVAATGINQGELSGLLRNKSFGEKKAEALERKASMPAGYLVCPIGLNRLNDERATYHAPLTQSHSVELDEATVVHALRAMQRVCMRRGWSQTIESLVEHADTFVDALAMYAGTADEHDQGTAVVLESISNQGNGDDKRVRREPGGEAGGKTGSDREAPSVQATAAAGRGGKRKK